MRRPPRRARPTRYTRASARVPGHRGATAALQQRRGSQALRQSACPRWRGHRDGTHFARQTRERRVLQHDIRERRVRGVIARHDEKIRPATQQSFHRQAAPPIEPLFSGDIAQAGELHELVRKRVGADGEPARPHDDGGNRMLASPREQCRARVHAARQCASSACSARPIAPPTRRMFFSMCSRVVSGATSMIS